MFTNNYITFQSLRFFKGDGTNAATFKDTNGSVFNGYLNRTYAADIGYNMKFGRCRGVTASVDSSYGSSLYPGIYFGDGSTPATKNDYALSSVITSGLSFTNPNDVAVEIDGNGKYVVSAPFIVQNTSEAEINIYEFGVFTPISTDTSASGSITWKMVLMERTVLSEPITILPGESKLVTYRLTFNQTMNVE